MNKLEFAHLLRITLTKWQKHDATLTAGALTFFTIMPLPSLALIGVAILAQVYGQPQALQQLVNQVSAFAGPSVAAIIAQVLKNAGSPLTSFFASLISVAFAISGAIGAFSVLQKSLNAIWEVKPIKRGWSASIREKAYPFLLIVGLSLIVIAWTTFSTVLFGAVVFVLNPLIGNLAGLLVRSLQVILSLGLGTLLFAIIFKTLPETKVRWEDVWIAAGITALVFTVLNYIFGLYVSVFQVTTLAGTAGALMVLFLWIYLMNLFILFGAEFSKVYVETRDSNAKKEGESKEEEIEKKLEIRTDLRIKVRDAKS
ncbi:MAG: YihY/virulence factor BrkB family protein [Nitrososphaerales archaeon]